MLSKYPSRQELDRIAKLQDARRVLSDTCEWAAMHALAVRRALNELGEPDESYPANVANAVAILKKVL